MQVTIFKIVVEHNSETIRKEFGKEIANTFEIILKNPIYTAEQIGGEIGKTARTVEKYIAKLKDVGIIKRKGPKLGGYWEINETS